MTTTPFSTTTRRLETHRRSRCTTRNHSNPLAAVWPLVDSIALLVVACADSPRAYRRLRTSRSLQRPLKGSRSVSSRLVWSPLVLLNPPPRPSHMPQSISHHQPWTCPTSQNSLFFPVPAPQQVVDLTQLQPHVARQLLQEKRWNYEELAELYFEVRAKP